MWLDKVEVSRRRLLVALAGGVFSNATLGTFPRAAGAAALASFNTTTFSSSITGLGQARGVAVDLDGNVYVADQVNNVVDVYTSAGSFSYSISVANAYGVAVHGSGAAATVYVLNNQANPEVWKSVNGGTPTLEIPHTTVSDSGTGVSLTGTTFPAVDAGGSLYIANSDRVLVWNGSALTTLSGSSGTVGTPQAVAVDTAGSTVYVSDSGGKVYVVTGGSASVLVDGSTLTPTATALSGIAVDNNDNVFFADVAAGAAYAYDPLDQTTSTLSTSLNAPKGVAVDVSGNVYVAEGAGTGTDSVSKGAATEVPPGGSASATPTPTPTPTPTATPSASGGLAPTPTPSISPSLGPSPTPTASGVATPTPTPTSSRSPSRTSSASATPTPTPTPTPTGGTHPSPTPTHTPAPTPSARRPLQTIAPLPTPRPPSAPAVSPPPRTPAPTTIADANFSFTFDVNDVPDFASS